MAGPNLARRTVRMMVFRGEYLRLRTERDLTDAKIKAAGVDPSGIWRWLNGETRRPRRSTVELLLNVLRPPESLRAELLDLALNPEGPGWVRAYEGVLPDTVTTYSGFEAEAERVRNWEPANVPGLLQTAAYTEAVIRAVPGVTDEHVARQLDVRRRRQAVLTATPPLHLHAVLGEAVLHQVVGTPATTKQQLLALGKQPENVTVQVVPFSLTHPGGTGSFVLMDFRDPRAAAAAVVESPAGLNFVDSDERLGRIWDRLASLALSPQDSAAYIAAAAKKMK